MKTRLWYDMINGGDGSAFPRWYESEALLNIMKEHEEASSCFEGLGEDCSGSIELESDSPITFVGAKTCESVIADFEKEMAQSYTDDDEKLLLQATIDKIKNLQMENVGDRVKQI